MKKETKKVKKVVTKNKAAMAAVNYRELYESMKVLSNNLSEELNYKADLAFERGGVIDELNNRLNESDKQAFWLSLFSLTIGVVIGLCL